MRPSKRLAGLAFLIIATVPLSSNASGESILGALSKAYENDSSLNSARANVRVTDESVAIAKSGWRPTIEGFATIDQSSSHVNGKNKNKRMTTGQYGVQIKQTLFDGFQTRNNVAAAESQVRASVESLGDTEENILFKAAQAYMDVVRDRQVSVPTHQNARFLTEQARAARLLQDRRSHAYCRSGRRFARLCRGAIGRRP